MHFSKCKIRMCPYWIKKKTSNTSLILSRRGIWALWFSRHACGAHSYFPVWIGQDHWKSFSLLTASSKPTNILICWCNTWMHLFLFSSLLATNIYLAHNYISDLLNIFWLDNFLGTWWYCDIVVTVGYKEWGYCCENESMLMILLITIWYSTRDIQ